MSVTILYELQHEVRRLFIAGSTMAAGDLRLSKLLTQLNPLAESSPVFKRMAGAVSAVIESDRETGAVRLLELGTLLNSVLYTQGKTEVTGDVAPLEGTELNCATPVSFRKLSPVIEALTSKGQGRLEVIRQAYEERLFQDFRIIPAAVAGVEDSYSEIADFIYQYVVPEYGAEALPALLEQFRLDGGRGAVRRLELIYLILGHTGTELYLKAAKEGSLEVRAAATELLGYNPDQEPFLLEQADEKRKELRAAAYTALARLGSDAAVERLSRAFASKDRDLAIEPIQLCQADELTRRMLEEADKALEQVHAAPGKSKDKERNKAVEHLMACVQALEGRRGPEVMAFLDKLVSTKDNMVSNRDTVQQAAGELLAELGIPEEEWFAARLHGLYDAHNRTFFIFNFRAAVRTLSPEEVYDRYAPALLSRRSPVAYELLRAIQDLTPSVREQVLHEGRTYAPDWRQTWDPRWLDVFMKRDDRELVCAFAQPEDKRAVFYLTNRVKNAPDYTSHSTVHMLLALFQMKHPEAPDLVMLCLQKLTDRPNIYMYLDQAHRAVLLMMPGSYVERLEQLAEVFPFKSTLRTHLLEAIRELRNRPAELGLNADDAEQNVEKEGTGLWDWMKNKLF
ncbi:HEAT repeat domain-containing protein [Paenibacillus sp. y28]|uniref:HEAT repeat domain-containing protein n=1 Tax=Paenibacillus sp. y28 TaxID=3129110 RepID=UPI0030173E55